MQLLGAGGDSDTSGPARGRTAAMIPRSVGASCGNDIALAHARSERGTMRQMGTSRMPRRIMLKNRHRLEPGRMFASLCGIAPGTAFEAAGALERRLERALLSYKFATHVGEATELDVVASFRCGRWHGGVLYYAQSLDLLLPGGVVVKRAQADCLRLG